MLRPNVVLRRSLIFIHRWMGVALCVLFMLWFVSGIFMMYWDYPGVGAEDRIARSPVLDPAKIRISPQEAYAKATGETEFEEAPSQRRIGNRGGRGGADGMRLNSFDGRPVYRFRAGRGEYIVYADTGEEQLEVTREMMDRVAAAWTGQPVSSARVEENDEEDQWTVAGNFRDLRPMLKYSFPNGEEVYISENNGEVVQYTTTASRLGAWVGAIPHWLYFTPLRKHQPEWSKFVIWSSGISTVASILGIAIGIWMLSPAKKYRFAGQPTSIPYKGQKRWHTILGLAFGILTATWAFSGMLSMGVIPTPRPAANAAKGKGKGAAPTLSIPQALRGGRFQLSAFAAKPPGEALRQLAGFPVKELEFTIFAGEPVYIASDGDRRSRIVPVSGEPMDEFDRDRIMNIVKLASPQGSIAELRVIGEYDRYYLDRRGRRPLPVIYARMSEPDATRYYIDPKSARVVQQYNSRGWINRWLYHGLHSLDFPWLYKYRPLWDIVVITLMLGCTALCVTSIVLTWRVLKRKLRPSFSVVLARKDPAPDAV